jgi:hypothetical protein
MRRFGQKPRMTRLQGPKKHLSPDGGKRVGGVSERPARDPERGNSLRRTRSRNGGKHLVCRKTALFAGRRRNAGLGRSGSSGGLLLQCCRTDDNGCSLGAEKGNDVSSRKRKPNREHPTMRASKSPYAEGTRPYLGPKARARQSSLHCGGESRRRWRVSRFIAVEKTRESGTNRHRGIRKRTERGSSRIDVLARGSARYVRKGRGSRPSSLRGFESSGEVPARRKSRSCRSR